MRANLFALAAMLALVAIPARADGVAGTIHVDITGFRNDNGQVLCDLYSSPEAFPGSPEHADAHTVASIAQGRAACEFHNVTPGRYAIGVVHDENKNGKLDRILGMPSEGVGTSRDAGGHMGPPKFDDAAFQYQGGALNLSVKIVYLL